LTDAPRTYGRIENIGGNFLMADGSVRWIAADVAEEVLAKQRGSNLAGDDAEKLRIQRPISFPYPADPREPWLDLKTDR
jgi:prepilin-type processing-associated H-X9-DG protein